MSHSAHKPCPTWSEKITTMHPDDLSLAERAELQVHMKTCFACASAYQDYQVMRERIRSLPVVEADFSLVLPATSLSPAKSAFFRHSSERETRTTRAAFVTMKGSPMSSYHQLFGWKRFMSASVIAAVILLLVGGAILLFTHQTASGTKLASRNTASTPPPTSTPVLTENDCSDKLETLKQVCEEHLLTKIGATQNLAGHVVTLQDAYADGIRILLKFTMQSSTHDGSITPLITTITTRQLQFAQGASGCSTRLSEETHIQTTISCFDGSGVPSATKVLQLHVQTALGPKIGPDAGPTAIVPPDPAATAAPPVSFDIMVPFYPAHSVNVNQTVTHAGVSVTLARFVVAPSALSVELKGSILRLSTDNEAKAYKLTKGNWSTGFDTGHVTNVTDKHSPVSGVILESAKAPADISGEWTLQVSGEAVQGTSGIWTFTFNVV